MTRSQMLVGKLFISIVKVWFVCLLWKSKFKILQLMKFECWSLAVLLNSKLSNSLFVVDFFSNQDFNHIESITILLRFFSKKDINNQIIDKEQINNCGSQWISLISFTLMRITIHSVIELFHYIWITFYRFAAFSLKKNRKILVLCVLFQWGIFKYFWNMTEQKRGIERNKLKSTISLIYTHKCTYTHTHSFSLSLSLTHTHTHTHIYIYIYICKFH